MADTSGVGNFIEMINFGIRRGDKTLQNHYDHRKNASYISALSQNDLIASCGNVILKDIINEIKKSKFVSILADECMDASAKEQLVLTLHYIH